ncbi:phage protein Gp27 family protein [Methylococcus sp. S1B]|uniref:phage protein Gp27 family protein n=1 Tax=Methylococcus sp. S1B TaxID=3435347 RepID=UPI003D7EB0FA
MGTAKWTRDYEARIRAEDRAKAADVATNAAKSQGVSPETIALIRRDVLGMAS